MGGSTGPPPPIGFRPPFRFLSQLLLLLTCFSTVLTSPLLILFLTLHEASLALFMMLSHWPVLLSPMFSRSTEWPSSCLTIFAISSCVRLLNTFFGIRSVASLTFPLASWLTMMPPQASGSPGFLPGMRSTNPTVTFTLLASLVCWTLYGALLVPSSAGAVFQAPAAVFIALEILVASLPLKLVGPVPPT